MAKRCLRILALLPFASAAPASAAVPFAAAARWAASTVPAACDEQSSGCNWAGAADAWRYAFNNLLLAMKATGEPLRSQLPWKEVKDMLAFLKKMGQDAGLWYGNWPNAAKDARKLMAGLEKWFGAVGEAQVALPRGIGTKFPAFGRSVAVEGGAVTLANGYVMPVLGFGTWQLPPDGSAYKAVLAALKMGYRHIDTAQGYRNEAEVGRAIRDSGVPRAQICIVTKLSNAAEFPTARKRFEEQLKLLGVGYVDVYMLHSPGKEKEGRMKAWRQMEALYAEGKIKALGVSNFNVPLLTELLGFAKVRPVYIQNKYSIYHPGNRDEAVQEKSLMEWLVSQRIVMTGYSIIHPAHAGYLSPMQDPHVQAIAKRVKRTPSQVLHRWMLQLGAAVIPRSTKPERIRENGALFDFSLSEREMRLLNGLAALVKSHPGERQAPRWCDDVYGISRAALEAPASR